jgi:hypothetical protein
VIQHQGRVQLEADWNEQGAIVLHLLRTLIVDLAGESWRPGGGFQPSWDAAAIDLKVTAGHFYVNGLLCENDSPTSFATQPWGPIPGPGGLTATKQGLFFIEAWERHMTALELPVLRELALGGLETTSRAQAVWQIRFWDIDALASRFQALDEAFAARLAAADDQPTRDRVTAERADVKALADTAFATYDCAISAKVLKAGAGVQPLLRVRTRPGSPQNDPCLISPDSAFRGRENQLYRVEIHDPGLAGTATFKWSRENASLAFQVLEVGPDGAGHSLVRLATLGRDARSGLCAGDWVEFSNDDIDLGQQVNPLAKVLSVDRGEMSIVTETALPVSDGGKHALLRRWDQGRGVDASGLIPVVEGRGAQSWLELEDGVQIQFQPGGLYVSGQHWVVAARVATGGVEWPVDATGAPLARPPHGTVRHQAPLAVLAIAGGVQAVTACGCTSAGICPP